MTEKDDWRLRGQESWLAGKTLYRIPFRPRSDTWDHEHCEFCWEKFMLHPDCLQEGYCTKPENGSGADWICPECCEDFRERFGWVLG